MEYRILGPLEVVDQGRSLSLGGSRQRTLLALLLLHPNEVVSTDRLVDELWGEQPPESGSKAVQVLVSQLRKALQGSGGDGALVTQAPGYAIRVGAGELDRERFESLVEKAAAAESAEARAELLREALGIWRGPPLADLSYEDFAQPAIARLTEARVAALEDRIEADLALGRHSGLAGELEELVAQHPLRERLRGHLMLALYRSGRQADALAVYRDGRRTLVDELGVEPSPELRHLQKQILEHDRALTPAPGGRVQRRATGASQRRRHTMIALLSTGAVAIAAVMAALVLGEMRDAVPVSVTPNSVAAIDPANDRVVDAVQVGESPGPIVQGQGLLWVLNLDDRTLSKIDPEDHSVVGSLGVPVAAGRNTPSLLLAAAGDDVWVYACHLELFRIEPQSTQIVQQLEVFRDIGAFSEVSCAIAATPGFVWAPLDYPQVELVRVEAPTDAPAFISDRSTLPPTYRSAMAMGGGSLWTADREGGAIRRIDPATGTIEATLHVSDGPSAMVFGHGAVWVANDFDDTVTRIDPRTNSVVRAISVGTDPVGLAASDDAIWVANSGEGTVSRIDPETNTVEDTVEVGHRPLGVAVADGLIWVTVRS
jgi:YVTN family beta-propeller protein